MVEVKPRKRVTARDVMVNKWVSENSKNYKRKVLSDLRKVNKNVQYNAAFLAFKAKKIKKALFSYFANVLATAEDKDMFTEMFRMMDVDGDGILTSDEFEQAMVRFQQVQNGENIREITKSIIKKGQSMELHEFINSAIVFNLIQQDQEKVLRQMFNALDSEGNDEVELDDLVEIFKDQGLPDVYIQMIVDYCDQDKNSKISYEEFREFIIKEDQFNL